MQALKYLTRYSSEELCAAYLGVGITIGAAIGAIRGFKLVHESEDSPLEAVSRGQLFYGSFIMVWGSVLGGISGGVLAFFSPVIIPTLIIRRMGRRKN
nr:hypothetical protein K-LCC10_0430 [Kaumoebavirus]